MYITCEDDVVKLVLYSVHSYLPIGPRGRGRDRMIVVFTTTYAINAYHH
jgi:hypothetical protein